MDHHEAEQSQAVARYILNEMGDDERDRFEEHYFDCRDCGADVLAGESMRANLRALPKPVPQPEPVPPMVIPFPPRPAWKRALDMAVAAMLAVVVTAFVIPRIQGPAPQPSMERASESFITGESRGPGAPPTTLRAGASDNLLIVIIKPEWQHQQYEFQLRRTDGKVDLTVSMTAEQAKDQVSLLPRSLPAGSYVLAIYGRTDGNRAVLATNAVRVQ